MPLQREPEVPPPKDDTKWVSLDMKLVNWAYLNYSIRVKLDTPLFSIKKRLVARHGRMSELRLYKDAVEDDNELVDEMITLEAAGVPGGTVDEAEVVRYAHTQACWLESPCCPSHRCMLARRVTDSCRCSNHMCCAAAAAAAVCIECRTESDAVVRLQTTRTRGPAVVGCWHTGSCEQRGGTGRRRGRGGRCVCNRSGRSWRRRKLTACVNLRSPINMCVSRTLTTMSARAPLAMPRGHEVG